MGGRRRWPRLTRRGHGWLYSGWDIRWASTFLAAAAICNHNARFHAPVHVHWWALNYKMGMNCCYNGRHTRSGDLNRSAGAEGASTAVIQDLAVTEVTLANRFAGLLDTDVTAFSNIGKVVSVS